MELVALLLQLPDLLAVLVFVEKAQGELVLCVVSGVKGLSHTFKQTLICVCVCVCVTRSRPEYAFQLYSEDFFGGGEDILGGPNLRVGRWKCNITRKNPPQNS